MQQIKTQRNIGIDLLRAVSLLYIVSYWHMFNYTNPFPLYNNFLTDIITRTILAVLVLISGFYAARGYRIENFNIWVKRHDSFSYSLEKNILWYASRKDITINDTRSGCNNAIIDVF
jgi:surface polysaccharide O-acyltransferase-like enzyme